MPSILLVLNMKCKPQESLGMMCAILYNFEIRYKVDV